MDSTENLYRLPGCKSLIVLSEKVLKGVHKETSSSDFHVRHKSLRFPNEDSLSVIEVLVWFSRYSDLVVKQLNSLLGIAVSKSVDVRTGPVVPDETSGVSGVRTGDSVSSDGSVTSLSFNDDLETRLLIFLVDLGVPSSADNVFVLLLSFKSRSSSDERGSRLNSAVVVFELFDLRKVDFTSDDSVLVS